MFVPGKPFQPSLMIVDKARSLLYSEAPERPGAYPGVEAPEKQGAYPRVENLKGQEPTLEWSA